MIFYVRVRTGLRCQDSSLFSTNLIVTLHEFRAVPTVFPLFGGGGVFPETKNFFFFFFFFGGFVLGKVVGFYTT